MNQLAMLIPWHLYAGIHLLILLTKHYFIRQYRLRLNKEKMCLWSDARKIPFHSIHCQSCEWSKLCPKRGGLRKEKMHSWDVGPVVYFETLPSARLSMRARECGIPVSCDWSKVAVKSFNLLFRRALHPSNRQSLCHIYRVSFSYFLDRYSNDKYSHLTLAE